jgi:amino acid adenylation domain-containing protein
MAGRFPGAGSLDHFWQNLVNGVDSVTQFTDAELEVGEATRQQPGYQKARSILADVDAFDADFFSMYPREAEQMDPQHRVFLECAWEALERAGYNPETFPGLIGVFAGCSMNTYFMHNLARDRAYLAAFAEGYQSAAYSTMLGNDKDFLPTRVSYKLNLRGPSLSIQTACSTSLVAVTQACQSLLTYSCDMALAGGVSITFPQRRGYLPEEGGIVSTDGRIRPFDKQANGTVFGHGAGIVVLKRLEDAVADRDQVLAVIRGFAANNDGSQRAGYTAPSREGQAAVIAAAQAMAAFDPATISYVEAHGTGTPLGDPIEVAALTQAFRLGTAGRQFCSLGTAKSHIGHLDVASGVVGLIKTVLQIQHRKIPGLLHFTAPNPALDLEGSPFVIQAETMDWQPISGVLRAGVSSFGVGGTNAHVVLEALPPQPMPPSSRYAQVLPLSARTPAALSAMQSRLADFLESSVESGVHTLENVAFTLQSGRKEFACRRAVVASDRANAIALLRASSGEDPGKGSTARKIARDTRHKIAFLFPGQGTQALGMGRLLFEQFPVFRAVLEEADQLIRPALPEGLIPLLYPPQDPVSEDPTNEAPTNLDPPNQYPTNLDPTRAAANRNTSSLHRLNQTSVAQPAIFAVSYALAKLWQSLGVEPAMLIGHSIGEFVAAAIAGTLSLADALELVVARGAIVQQLPPGAMLAIRASESEAAPFLRPFLDSALDLASINGPRAIVVAGTHQAVEALAARLSDAGIAARKLSTSHAFHSRMMDQALEPFSRSLAKVSFHAPSLPWISTLTGKPVEAHEVTQPEYWLRQLRSPVLFANATEQACREGVSFFLEVGPGQTLSNLIKQNALIAQEAGTVATLPDNVSSGQAPFRTAVARLWEEGIRVDWQRLRPEADSAVQRVPLPTYPFERKRYWVDPPAAVKSEEGSVSSAPERRGTEGVNVNGTTLNRNRKVQSKQVTPEAWSMLADPVGASTDLTATDSLITDRLIAALKSLVSELSDLDLTETPANTSWMQLGLDSLFLTQLTQAVRNAYGVKLSFRQIMSQYATFDSLAAHLAQVAPKDKLPLNPKSLAPDTRASGTHAGLTADAKTGMQLSLPTSLPPGADAYTALFSQQMAAMTALMHKQMEMLAGMSGHAGQNRSAGESNPPPVLEQPPAVRPELGTILPLRSADAGGIDSLPADQELYLQTLLDRVSRKTAGSKASAQRYRRVLADPRVASRFNQQFKEAVYPLVVERSKGAHLWDIDGNRYVDILNGYGSILFGHSPDFVTEAIQRQLERGFPIGPQTELAGECALLLTDLVGMERATFCNTGSEAVMAALRIARTVTGRSLVVVFAGSYHGQIDEVLVKSTRSETSIPTAPGIPRQSVANMLVLEYGSAHALEVIRQRADEIAAVLVEPVQSRHPELQPVAFLKEVRSITEQAGAALIFDEVVTGFRSDLGGAQKLFGIRADLATYGKVVAGGMPVGVVAGSRTYMDALDGGSWQFGDDSSPQVGVTFFAGTFVRHPLTMAAVKATLEHLQDQGPALQAKLATTTASLAGDLNLLFDASGFPARIRHFASWFHFALPPEARLARLLYVHLREQGLHLQEGFPCFLTTAHTAEDLQHVRDAFRHSLNEMHTHGVLGEGKKAPGPATIPKASKEAEEAPITESQREILLASQLGDEASCAFNESVTLHLSGRPDQATLIVALEQVVARHEALRLTVGASGETIRVKPRVPVLIDTRNWRSLAEADQQLALRSLLHTEATTPFHLQQGPLFRCTLILLAEDRAAVVFTGHHIILDGWSINQIFAEWGQIYSRLLAPSEQSTPAPGLLPVRSFLDQARSESADHQAEAFWLETFRTLPPPLDLPTDRPRPSLRTNAGNTFKHLFPASLMAALRSASAQNGNTLFSTLLSAYAVLLSRLAREQDIVIGIPVAGQGNFPGQSLVGHAVHFLPLRVDVSPELSFADLATLVQGKVYDALDHQEYTLGTLVRKLKIPSNPARLALGEVQFNLEQVGTGLHFAGLETTLEANPKAAVNADIFFNFVDRGKDLALECDYNTALFDAGTIERWVECLQVLLEDAALSLAQPDQAKPVAALDWLTAPTQKQLLVDWNQTAKEYPSLLPVHQVFEQQAAQTPDAVALRFGERVLTYSELNAQANCCARLLLRRHAPGTSVRVAVCLERSPELIVTLLGILKAGGQYIPIDPGYPAARMSLVFEDAEPSLLVTQPSLQHNFKQPVAILTSEELSSAWALESAENLQLSIASDAPAYMMYTSGSTGQPKGVVVPHRAITRLVVGTDFIRFAPDEVFLQLAPVSFDASTLEIWGALLHGSTLVLMPGSKPSPEEIGAAIQRYGVTTLWLTAALFHLMVMDHLPLLAPLRQLVAGGDVLSVPLVQKVVAALPHLRLVNGYGPTENTTFTCCYTIPGESLGGTLNPGNPPASVPIGTPIANTRVYLLDDHQRPVPVGVPGELYAAGDGLALGYWKAAEQTAEKFVEVTLPLVGHERLYRTGDLACYRNDGVIEFLGRRDHQIKVRGFRVEPREIEAAAERFPGVRAAIVSARPDWTMPMDIPGDPRLVLYVLAEEGLEFSALKRELSAFLREQLPDAMQPAAILAVKQFPRTANGKVDYRALPLPAAETNNHHGAGSAPGQKAVPRNPVEAELVSIWKSVLHLDAVGIDDSIFELGGDSLSIFRITTLANQSGIGVTAQQIFQYKTIAALSPRLEAAEASLAGPAPTRPTIRAVPREQFRRETSLAPVEP